MKLFKLIIVFQLLVLISTKAFSQNTAISDVTYTPAASAVLDVYSTSKGMLVPRMTEAQKISITSPENGLLVYQTDGAAGFWYYDGIQWLQFFNSNTGWMTTGNSGTVDGTHFLGTTDDVPLTFRVSNQISGRVSSMDNNTYFGFNAGLNNTDLGSTFIGYRAGQSNLALGNSAVGVSALRDNTFGTNNTALGFASLMVNTTGFDNAAFGTSTLYSNASGNQNTAVGSNALFTNTSGNGNTALGQNSLYFNTTGSYNSGLGVNSLRLCTTGTNNVATGYQCLSTLTTGSSNTAAGYQSLNNLTTANNNTAAGYQSLNGLTTGANNTAVGYQAGKLDTTGSNGTFIGYAADATTGALTNVTAIGYNAKVATNNSMVLGSTTAPFVNIGVGVSSPTNTLSFNGTAARTIWMERHTTAASAGSSLTLQAGGAYSTGTNLNGGDLNLSSGTSTGTGSSNIYFKTAPAGSTGTIDNAPTTRMTISGNGIQVTGSVSVAAPRVLSGAQTLTATDYIVINTGAVNTWTLPANSTGRVLIIVNHGTGNITTSPVFRSASGTNTGIIASGTTAQIVYDGSEWRKIN